MPDEPKSIWGKLAVVTAFLTAVGTLVATLQKCSGGEDDSHTHAVPSATPAPAPTPSPAPAPAPTPAPAPSPPPMSSGTSGDGNANPMQRPAGFPPGYGMQVCGCWGYNPPPIAPEPLCASGYVRINYCPGVCAGGGYPYAYVCR